MGRSAKPKKGGYSVEAKSPQGKVVPLEVVRRAAQAKGRKQPAESAAQAQTVDESKKAVGLSRVVMPIAAGVAVFLALAVGWELIREFYPFVPVEPLCGVFGALVGGAAIELFGIAAFAAPFLALVIGSAIARSPTARIGATAVGCAVFISSLAAAFSLVSTVNGGLVGRYLALPLWRLVGPLGAWCAVVGVIIAVVWLGLRQPPCAYSWSLLLAVARAVTRVVRGVGSFLLDALVGVPRLFGSVLRALFRVASVVRSTVTRPRLHRLGAPSSVEKTDSQPGRSTKASKKGSDTQPRGLVALASARQGPSGRSRGAFDYAAPKLERPVQFEAGSPALRRGQEGDKDLAALRQMVGDKLRDFHIDGEVIAAVRGPVVTLVEFRPAKGVKVGKIAGMSDDLKLALRTPSVRIVAPLPGRDTVGIEVPNAQRDTVYLRDLVDSPQFLRRGAGLPIALGRDIHGEPVVIDIAAMPHLLMAGATGTGKSVCINTILVSLLSRHSPDTLRLILVDPKVLELSVYEGVPHLLVPVVTVAKQAKSVLAWAVREMEERYKMMQRFGVRNVDGYNAVVQGEASAPSGLVPDSSDLPASLPKIVIVIDELADLMFQVGRDIEELITRLAQKARAAGIHLVLATQRPSVDVITGLIKANFPLRLSFRVTSRIDSRTILDQMGAESLVGRGDMLLMQPGAGPLRRVHGAFVSDDEVHTFVSSLKSRYRPQYCERALASYQEGLEESSLKGGELADEGGYDAMYDKAVQLVIERGNASTSMIQRALRIGYNRAARIIDMMEKEGVVGPMDGVKPREVLVKRQSE